MKPFLAWLMLPVLTLAWLVPARAADTVVYYHTDALRSVAVVTDAQGRVLERTYYAPYGAVLNRPLRDGPGYTGHIEDAETGLVYMQQRYYDPESGRFLSADPVQTDGNGGNFNRYWYANNNPYTYTDPDGRCPGSLLSNCDFATSPTTIIGDVQGMTAQQRIVTAAVRLNQGISYLDTHEKGLAGIYSSPLNAKTAFGKVFAAISGKLGLEFGANITTQIANGRVGYVLMDFSISRDFIKAGYANAGLAAAISIPGRPQDPGYWGFVHTHYMNPIQSQPFSYGDIQTMINRGVSGYVIFPDQSYHSFDFSRYNPLTESPAYVFYHQAEFEF